MYFVGRTLCLAVALLLAHGTSAQIPDRTDPAHDAEGSQQGPPPPLPNLSDPNSRTGEALAEPDAGSGIPKTLRGSANKAGGPANDLNPGDQTREAPLPQSNLANVIAGKELFHGNYCGAGQRDSNLAPTDDLDAACQRHDTCYDTAGYRSCACDGALRREAAGVSERPSVSLQVRQRALSVAEAADAMGCRSP